MPHLPPRPAGARTRFLIDRGATLTLLTPPRRAPIWGDPLFTGQGEPWLRMLHCPAYQQADSGLRVPEAPRDLVAVARPQWFARRAGPRRAEGTPSVAAVCRAMRASADALAPLPACLRAGLVRMGRGVREVLPAWWSASSLGGGLALQRLRQQLRHGPAGPLRYCSTSACSQGFHVRH